MTTDSKSRPFFPPVFRTFLSTAQPVSQSEWQQTFRRTTSERSLTECAASLTTRTLRLKKSWSTSKVRTFRPQESSWAKAESEPPTERDAEKSPSGQGRKLLKTKTDAFQSLFPSFPIRSTSAVLLKLWRILLRTRGLRAFRISTTTQTARVCTL